MKKCLLAIAFIFCIFATGFAQKNDTITTASGLKYFFIKKGSGPVVQPGQIAIVDYILTLSDGTKIDATRDRGVPFAEVYPSAHVISGYNEAISLLHIGDRGIFIMPYTIAYGEKGSRGIPPKATLIFDYELLDVKAKSLKGILDSVAYAKPMAADSTPHTEAIIKTYKQLKKQGFGDLYVSEDDLNSLGYALIKKHPADAVELFKLNLEMYPKSYNVYDSLAEGYMDIGDNRRAIKNYKKSLELNPKNTNATDMINKMNAEKK